MLSDQLASCAAVSAAVSAAAAEARIRVERRTAEESLQPDREG